MPSVEIEPAIPEIKGRQIHALDRTGSKKHTNAMIPLTQVIHMSLKYHGLLGKRGIRD
jgi:hypothetical protein